MPHVHPELTARHRWLPRGLGRRWLLPLLRGLFRLGGAASRAGTQQIGDNVSAMVLRPDPLPNGTLPGLLWIHGGGLVMGDPRQDEVFLRRVANELGIVVVAPQYRLAPEHPFPAPLDDVETALRWLADAPEVDPTRLAIGGASAGGGLAAALCQRVRGSDLRPAAQIFVYPMLDDRTASQLASQLEHTFRLWDRASNHFGWSSYLGQLDRTPPAFSVPARATDLRDLPPAWIGVGTLDLFHDEDVRYAARLQEAGVDVELWVVEGAYHGFNDVDPNAAVTREFQDRQIARLARALHLIARDPSEPERS